MSLMTEAVTNQGTLIVYTTEGGRKSVITGDENVVTIFCSAGMLFERR
jgi:hypothetical protein